VEKAYRARSAAPPGSLSFGWGKRRIFNSAMVRDPPNAGATASLDSRAELWANAYVYKDNYVKITPQIANTWNGCKSPGTSSPTEDI
jgi:hypothetical protein